MVFVRSFCHQPQFQSTSQDLTEADTKQLFQRIDLDSYLADTGKVAVCKSFVGGTSFRCAFCASTSRKASAARGSWGDKAHTDRQIKRSLTTQKRQGSNRLSEYEFEVFVRERLMLSHWDIMPSDLHDFYHFLDRDGDGIDIFEFLDYVKKVNRLLLLLTVL